LHPNDPAVTAFLQRAGLGAPTHMEVLPGGVSSDIWRVDLESGNELAQDAASAWAVTSLAVDDPHFRDSRRGRLDEEALGRGDGVLNAEAVQVETRATLGGRGRRGA